MNITDFLKIEDGGARLEFDDKWLYWGENEWVVRQRKYRAKNSQVLITTVDLSEAIDVLRKG